MELYPMCQDRAVDLASNGYIADLKSTLCLYDKNGPKYQAQGITGCTTPTDNLSCFAHGCSTGWVSGALGAGALGGGAWLAALPCLVALPAAPFFAVLADARGRKPGAAAICCSFIISWSLAAWCGTRGVWAARVAAGAGGAGALALAPVYCAEIAPRTRGLAAMPALACSCGILFAYAAGGVLSPHALSLSMAVPPSVLLVSLLWLPETPSFLISVGKIQDAAKVMCWFDGSDFREDLTDVIEQQEVRIRTSVCHGSRRRELCRQDSDAFQPMLKRISGLESNTDSRKTEPSAFRELFRHRRTRRALVSCCILLAVSAGSGAGAVTSFAASVLQYTAHGASLNHTGYNVTFNNRTVPRRGLFETSEAASLLCGTCLVLGAAVATITVDKIGRKMLLIWSCSGIACCLALLGAYCDPRLRTYSWSHMHHHWPYRSKLHNNFNNSFNVTNTKLNEEGIWPNNSTKWDEQISGSKQFKENDGSKQDSGADIDSIKWDVPSGTTLFDPEENTSVNSTEIRNKTEISRWKEMKVMNHHAEERETIWPPVILLSAVLFLYNIGLGSVPFVLMTELFSINVRSLASSFLISWMWLSCFLVLRYYGTVAISLGLHDTYYICGSVTLLGSVYTFLFVPETKGKSQKQIDDDLEGTLLVGLKRKRKNREDP